MVENLNLLENPFSFSLLIVKRWKQTTYFLTSFNWSCNKQKTKLGGWSQVLLHPKTKDSTGRQSRVSTNKKFKKSWSLYLFEMDHFQFLPGTASLVEEVDKKLLVVLRDGRKLVGTLRSFDQFGTKLVVHWITFLSKHSAWEHVWTNICGKQLWGKKSGIVFD